MAEGYHDIREIPDGHRAMNPMGRRQKLALQAGDMAVEPALADTMRDLEPPLGFLDFETVARAVPVWDGLKPWGTVPVQFSYHERAANGSLRHVEWLADGPEDPRPGLARALVGACRGANHILVYTAFEKTQINHLTSAVPELADELADLRERLFDLFPVVRNNVYHPDFEGSFSIKSVLPVLVPELGYDELEVAEGMTASVKAAELMLRGGTMDPGEREQLRADLLDYCRMDSVAMVKLLDRLRTLAGLTE